jgi:glycosidase
MKKLIFFFLFSILFFACNKEKDDNNPPPPPDDTTSFTVPQTQDIVMYEVNLRALSVSGDIQGVIGRLGEVKNLGINVIWLMPIHPIGEVNSVNSPYSVKNYKEVNPEFGSLNDLKTLVNEAHKKKIAVILDWVANHTAWDNPWIVYKDWYTQDGQGNIVHPPGTNWLDVADLDYNCQEMRLAMIEAMEYWVRAADVDGFRCDAADMVPLDFWQQAIDSVNGSTEKGLIWLAEGGNVNLFTAGFQMNYSWNYYSKLKDVFQSNHSANTLVTVHNAEYAAIPEGKHKLRFTTNHDESAWDATPMVIFSGEKGALAASVAAIYLGGIPLIYGSQEVGVEETIPFFSNQPVNWSQHPEMLEAYKDIFAFYNGSVALRTGEMESHATSDVLAFTRVSGQEEVFVIDNVRNRVVSYNIPAEFVNTTWEEAFNNSTITLSDKIDLGAYEFIVLKND